MESSAGSVEVPQESTRLIVAVIILVLVTPKLIALMYPPRVIRAYRRWRWSRFKKRQQSFRMSKLGPRGGRQQGESHQAGLGQTQESGPSRQLSTDGAVRDWQDTIPFPARTFIRVEAGEVMRRSSTL